MRAVHWYPGHMATGLQKMRQRVADLDVVVELRDARIPFSSALPQLDELFASIPRVVVFNKTDLADATANSRLVSTDTLLCCNEGLAKTDLRPLLAKVRNHLVGLNGRIDYDKRHRMMVVGIPNVGKSTLINRIRAYACEMEEGNAPAVKVGNLPGVTRSVSGIVRVCDKPLLYMYDTPGILLPRYSDAQQAWKLALTGAVPASQVNEEDLCRFLLDLIPDKTEIFAFYRIDGNPTLTAFLEAAARRLGLLLKGGEPNTSEAAKDVVRRYRQGKFGRFTLDSVP